MIEKLFIIFLFIVGIILGILSSYFDYLIENFEDPEEEEEQEPELIRPEALEKYMK